MNLRILLPIVAGTLALSLAGCGGSASSAAGLTTNPRIRVANMMSSPNAVSISLTPQTGASIPVDVNSAQMYVSSYLAENIGSWTVQFTGSTTNASLTSVTQNFLTNGYYSVIGYDAPSSGYATMILSDALNFGNQLGVRVVNCQSNGQSVDVYVTLAGASITGQQPTTSNVAVGDNTQTYSLWSSPGSYTITVTPHGSQSITKAYTTVAPLSIGQGATFVIADDSSGAVQIYPLPAYSY